MLGVTGGIAAYKACELTRLLVKAGHEVVPLVTPGAQRFVTEETFLALARRPAAAEDPYPHLTRADLLVVAPCTANTLAKLAHGIADNVLTEAALAHRGPVLVAPAMNPRMWAHPATRANVEALRERGVELVGPDEGEMAEGEWGVGRLAEPSEIAARVEQLLAPGSLAGRRVLVTAGGTREPLDTVRFVGNRSSGRMGVALAEEARRRGRRGDPARRQPVRRHAARGRDDPDTDRRVDARRRARAARRRRRAARGCRGRLPPGGGARRQAAEGRPGLDGRAGADARRRPRARGARSARARCSSPSAPSMGEEGLERKRAMLETKNADLVVFNDVGRSDIGFDVGENEVVLVTREGERTVPKALEGRDRVRDPRRGREALGIEAVVMAAGEGTRLRPITATWPKPVLPIDGVPVVVTLVHELAAAGCGPIVVVTGHLAEQVEAILAPLPYDLRFVRQPPGLGSADAVARAEATPPYVVTAADTRYSAGALAALRRRSGGDRRGDRAARRPSRPALAPR